MGKSRKALLTTVMLATLSGAPALWGGGSQEGMGMMGKDGMSSGQMNNMMPMMKMMGQMNDHMKQMDKMIKNCNEMMQTMMNEHQSEQAAPENG